MSTLDLDAERAARRAETEPLQVTLGGVTYELWDTPLKVGMLLARADFHGAVAEMFGADNAQAVLDAGITMPELNTIIAAAADHFLGARKAGQGNRRASSSKES